MTIKDWGTILCILWPFCVPVDIKTYLNQEHTAKQHKKAIKKAESDWSYVFTTKKWDELLPKDILPSIDSLQKKPQLKRESCNIGQKDFPETENLAKRISAPIDLKTQNQVEFLYSLWNKAPKKVQAKQLSVQKIKVSSDTEKLKRGGRLSFFH